MASSQRVSEATISPTNPRSGVVRFLRARKINPSPPESPTAAWPCAAQRRYQLLVHSAAQHHQRGIAGFRIGDAQAGDKLTLLAHLLQGAGQRRAAAVHHGDLVAILRQHRDRPRTAMKQAWIFECRTTEFDYEFHASPSASSHPHIRFIFSTACPAAPLSRLSRQETTIHRRPSFASLKPMSQ